MRAPTGVFGGTFDPIHRGHLRVAVELRDQLELARVHLVPAHPPVHRDLPRASANARSEMIRLAIEGLDGLVLDKRELRRAGPSYMYETLSDFRSEFTDSPICLIVGMDAFAALHTWYRWQDIFDLAHVVVAQRPHSTQPREGLVCEMTRDRLVSNSSDLKASLHGLVLFADVPGLDVSSSGIRDMLEQGYSAQALVPNNVTSYIRHEGLYTHGK